MILIGDILRWSWQTWLMNISEFKMSSPYRCPPVKTVPYTCAPGATDTSQCIYGEVIIISNLIQIFSRFIPWHLLLVRRGIFALSESNGLHWPWEHQPRWPFIDFSAFDSILRQKIMCLIWQSLAWILCLIFFCKLPLLIIYMYEI